MSQMSFAVALELRIAPCLDKSLLGMPSVSRCRRDHVDYFVVVGSAQQSSSVGRRCSGVVGASLQLTAQSANTWIKVGGNLGSCALASSPWQSRKHE